MVLISRWTGAWLLFTLHMTLLAAYPGGAPYTACDNMTPEHGFSAQNSASFYDINPSASSYCPKNEVNITLVGAPYGVTFKGFLCQARTAIDSSTTIGSLTSIDSKVETKNSCADEASLTHSDSVIKKEVHLQWTPDTTMTNSVYIVCRVVQQKSTYWVKQSTVIAYAGSGKCSSEGEVKGLPTSCSDSQTCEMAVSMAICDTEADADGQCVCPRDMKIAHPTHTYCSPKRLGDSCMGDPDCIMVPDAVCDMTVTPNVCACKAAFTSNTTEICYLKVLGDVCSSNDDCRGIPKSVCNSMCVCPPEYKHQRNQTHTNCVLRALNEQCTSDTQCAGTANATCIDERCKVGGSNVCTSNTDCTGTEGNECVEGKCTSGATKTALLSFIVLFGCFLLSCQILTV